MKVISGLYKGRTIEGHNIDGTRPTMERVKESLFAIIQEKTKESIILDLFSGSGNLAIEALSQGAKYAYFVDKNKKATNYIKINISKIGINQNQVEIMNLDYKKALQKLAEKKVKLDLIFLDPPYDTNYIEESIKLIEKYHLLNENGLIICESNSLERIIYSNTYTSVKEKKYGDKWVVILK